MCTYKVDMPGTQEPARFLTISYVQKNVAAKIMWSGHGQIGNNIQSAFIIKVI